MARRSVFAALSLGIGLLAATGAHAQSPSFDAASIKLNPNCEVGSGRPGSSPGGLNLPCVSLRALLRLAYSEIPAGASLPARFIQVVGGPAWLDTERYDLSTKTAGSASPTEMLGAMLQALLAERFQVKVHKEARDTAVYALTVAKSNPKLRPSPEGSCTPMDLNSRPGAVKPGDPRPKLCGGGGGRMGSEGVMITDWYGITMAEFCSRMIVNEVDRPVVDQTGLTGRFDLHLEYAHQLPLSGPTSLNGVPASLPAPTAGAPGASIFTALQEQLGLKLSAGRSPLDVLIVDRAEKPTAN